MGIVFIIHTARKAVLSCVAVSVEVAWLYLE